MSIPAAAERKDIDSQEGCGKDCERISGGEPDPVRLFPDLPNWRKGDLSGSAGKKSNPTET